jgi:hypothetical protein
MLTGSRTAEARFKRFETPFRVQISLWSFVNKLLDQHCSL